MYVEELAHNSKICIDCKFNEFCLNSTVVRTELIMLMLHLYSALELQKNVRYHGFVNDCIELLPSIGIVAFS